MLLGWNAKDAVEEFHLQRQFALWFRDEPKSIAVELSPTDVAEEEDPPEIRYPIFTQGGSNKK